MKWKALLFHERTVVCNAVVSRRTIVDSACRKH